MPIYTDIDLGFKKNTATGDIGRLNDRDCVRNSIKAIATFDQFDIPFDDASYSQIKKLLFEIPSPIIATTMRSNIRWIIEKLEPRVELHNVEVEMHDDGRGYIINIKYMIKALRENDEVTFNISRVR